MSRINTNRQNISVLAVDDEFISREILSKMIEAQGYTVETAVDGKQALSMWQAQKHAIIFTDCHMPNMDGYALTNAIRDIELNEGMPHTKIIALTADSSKEQQALCNQAGMDNFLTKPINSKKLEVAFSETLNEENEAISSDSLTPDSNEVLPTLIDYTTLNQIFPDKTKQIKVLGDLQNHVHTTYADLKHQVEAADIHGVESLAHRMKGSCKMVGVNSIADVCAEIEQEARNGSIAEALALSTLDQSIRAFDHYMHQQPATHLTPTQG